MQVLRDVIVQRDGDIGLVAIGQAPGVVGEQLTLDLAGGGHLVTCQVRVEESRPVILDGSVRHRIRLGILERQRRPEVVASALGQMHEALVG
jgi:hypothetical protein